MDYSYICPKCGGKIVRNGGSFVCDNRHSYDTAKSGYVNLLLSNQMNTKLPGDNKLMVNARRSFLGKGYYAALAEKFCETVKKHAPENALILDAGCGEGYYTVNAAKALPSALIMGTDISKAAVDAAAKHASAEKVTNTLFSVSSIFHMPVESCSCDMLFSLFAPYCRDEFTRVLKNGGIMIMVIPSENHLWELKKAIYDEPYKNDVKGFEEDGFVFKESIKVTDRISMDNSQDIQDLFSMTPYYYKTSEEGHRRLDALNALETEIGFYILVYGKN
jgi:23S rRNA (guanine745-N1)-methyltransferase